MHGLTPISDAISVVGVESDANKFVIIDYPSAGKWLMQGDSKNLNAWKIKLPKGNWQLLGICSKDEMDFDCEGLVECVGNWNKRGKTTYVDYINNKNCFTSNNDSFRSLLASKQLYWVNPLGEKAPKFVPMIGGFEVMIDNSRTRYFRELKNQWQAAESKRITGKLVVLKLFK